MQKAREAVQFSAFMSRALDLFVRRAQFQAMAVRLSVRHPKSAPGQAGELHYELDQTRIVIGRGVGADVRLPDLSVSESHALLEQAGLHYTLRDEESSNGTWVNGVALVPLRPRGLSEGDVITIGAFTLLFASGPTRGQPAPAERTASLARRMLRELLGQEHKAASPPFLRVAEGPDAGTLVNLNEPPATLRIGRAHEADLVLQDHDASRLHVELVRDHDGTTARDLESKNGIEVNGKRLRERRLRHGDHLRLGSTLIVYEDPAEEALRQLEGQRDVTVTTTRSVQVELAATDAPAAPTVPSPPTPKALPDEAMRSDLVVYALALFVLVASLLGLAWLFGS